MKLVKLLASEIGNYLDDVLFNNPKQNYYNEILGDTSFLLAGLLQSLLKQRENDWEKNRWIDDSLIPKVIMHNQEVCIEGVMIWGIEYITEQWTSPFSFNLKLIDDRSDFEKFTFLFYDSDQPEISYEIFKVERDFWNRRKKNWKYQISSTDKWS